MSRSRGSIRENCIQDCIQERLKDKVRAHNRFLIVVLIVVSFTSALTPMPFQSLRQVLGNLETQEKWKNRQQFQRLLMCWVEVVGNAVAAQTRPLYIQRQVLHVAASSAAWAQNLAFERQRILNKLNTRLSSPLTDIRFSTAQWQSQKSDDTNFSESDILWQNHPSQLSPALRARKYSPPVARDPQTAFQNWAKVMRDRSQHLPFCPLCHCPTPPGELQRWSICAVCAAKGMKR